MEETWQDTQQVIYFLLKFLPSYQSKKKVAQNVVAKLDAQILQDDRTFPTPGHSLVRFVHLSPDAPAVDIRVKNGPTLFTNVAFTKSTTYLSVAQGTYDLQVVVHGTNTVALEVPAVNLDIYRVSSIFAEGLLSGSGTTALQAIQHWDV